MGSYSETNWQASGSKGITRDILEHRIPTLKMECREMTSMDCWVDATIGEIREARAQALRRLQPDKVQQPKIPVTLCTISMHTLHFFKFLNSEIDKIIRNCVENPSRKLS